MFGVDDLFLQLRKGIRHVHSLNAKEIAQRCRLVPIVHYLPQRMLVRKVVTFKMSTWFNVSKVGVYTCESGHGTVSTSELN